MQMVFAVLVVDKPQAVLRLCGLTVDRLFTPKIINASGRNFINVNANRYGGLGVTIAPHQNLAIGQFGIVMAMI